ncbi:MAG: hypothetical protein GTN35_05820 [Nitrososphaeria archaeon]|nr:hypothetical protein [Nitrosopumilaceae archaeon]NIP10412.1 hypothetical protein [Nitrosopumilaceae archaeon]NIP91889.1 hypothetical protein [Nitrososphaeria archaeon]NIS95958.1 hypothetical protein [Nitrosopumilaceae archaeon]
MVVYAAIAGMLALMGFFAWYASLENPELEKVELDLIGVEIGDVNKVENTAEVKVTFLVTNPGEKTFTIALINYDIFADGEFLATGQYSTADIPMPGRPIFSSGIQIPIENTLELQKSEISNELYQAVLDQRVSKFKVEGMITTESAWSIVEKEFEAST